MRLKFLKLLIVPLIVTVGYLFMLSLPYLLSKINYYNFLGPFSVIEENPILVEKTPSLAEKTDRFDRHLLQGDTVTMHLNASENNFGIVLFRFAKLSGKVTDSVTFNIKQEGAPQWYYTHTYRANQFQADQYFAFGFPPFTNSKNHSYIVAITSLSGTYTNGTGISQKTPDVALVYKYSRGDLKHLPTLFSFITKKLRYVIHNVNFFQDSEAVGIFIISLVIVIYIKDKDISFDQIVKFSKRTLTKKKTYIKIFQKAKAYCISLWKRISHWFTATTFYTRFFNTHLKRKLIISIVLFLFAALYRYTASLVDQQHLFYAGLGGQSDYDQFIRAATCALKLCPAILGQNFLFETAILGAYYMVFGFVGGLQVYVYFMIILSSIVAVLPYILLSRKTAFTIGGIIGSLFLATSDYLTYTSIGLPPDNGSLFTFSIFFIVYLLTMQYGTIRWLLFFGLMGTIDGLNKLVFLVNDLPVLTLFIPTFFLEKAKRISKFPFITFRPKLLFYSAIPFFVFLILYSAWEYFVQIRFSTPYYLRALIQGGSTFSSSTIEGSRSFGESLTKGNILETLYYYAGLLIVMLKRLIENAGLNSILLMPILFGLLLMTFRKTKFFMRRLLFVVIFVCIAFTTLQLFRNNFLGIQNVGDYVYAWGNDVYINVFLFLTIIFLFILNFKKRSFILALPILPYVLMIIILTKNAPWIRMLVHIIVWSIILFSFLIDWVLRDHRKNYTLKGLWIGSILLIIFIAFYITPKTLTMMTQLFYGINAGRAEVTYLRWVNSSLPANAIILGGGKSDLITVAKNIKRPLIYNTSWTAAMLIKPREIPRIKATDFAILDQLKISQIPGLSPSYFSITAELKNKDNFQKKKYLILEDDIDFWRGRMAGIGDNLFSTSSAVLLHYYDYSVKLYKFNTSLNKGIYELKYNKTENM